MSAPACGSRHPEQPNVTCALTDTNHDEHFGLGLYWPNEEYQPPVQRKPDADLRQRVVSAVAGLLDRPKVGEFGGDTYVPEFDRARLGRQLGLVYDLMVDRQWRTLAEIGEVVDEPEASVSARLRDLRKPDFGGFTVERRRRGNPADGVHEYRLGPPEEISG